MKQFKQFLNEVKKYKTAYYKDVNGDYLKASYENGRYYVSNMKSVEGNAEVYDELPKDLEFIGTPRTVDSKMFNEAVNPRKKEMALDFIVMHTDATNDKEANEYLMDMMGSGMDIDDIIDYFERG